MVSRTGAQAMPVAPIMGFAYCRARRVSRRYAMRCPALCAVLAAALLACSSLAWGRRSPDRAPNAKQLAELEARAAAATPRDQPWLYAEIVHSMTDIATAQFQAGQDQQAAATLRQAQGYAGHIRVSLLRGARRLQKAEILVRHTAFRLRQLLLGASLRDRPMLEATIRQLNQVQSEMLNQFLER
jgi:signal transduction histidine kinase